MDHHIAPWGERHLIEHPFAIIGYPIAMEEELPSLEPFSKTPPSPTFGGLPSAPPPPPPRQKPNFPAVVSSVVYLSVQQPGGEQKKCQTKTVQPFVSDHCVLHMKPFFSPEAWLPVSSASPARCQYPTDRSMHNCSQYLWNHQGGVWALYLLESTSVPTGCCSWVAICQSQTAAWSPLGPQYH